MKNWRLLFVLASVALCLGLASCKDDQSDVSADGLVGRWQCTWSKGYTEYPDYPNRKEQWDEAETDGDILVFNSDGTGNSGEDFTWLLKGDRLTVSLANYPDSYATIKKQTSSELMLEYFEEGTDEGIPCLDYELQTYKKL